MDKNIISGGTLRAAQSVPPSQPASLDPRQDLALSEWRRLSKNGQPPRRADFRPERITRALPVSTLIGVERDGGTVSFCQRIEGKMTRIAFGEHGKKSFDERVAPDHLAQALPAFNEAVRDGRVTLTRVAAHTAGGAPFNFTRLLLPFTDEKNQVVRVLAVYGFDVDRLVNLRSPLRMSQKAAVAGMHPAEQAYLRLRTA
jgi:hypothetical protein